MTVKLIAVLECDTCGVTRGHAYTDNITTASHELRRSAANLVGWTVFGNDKQLDECAECGSRNAMARVTALDHASPDQQFVCLKSDMP